MMMIMLKKTELSKRCQYAEWASWKMQKKTKMVRAGGGGRPKKFHTQGGARNCVV